MENLWESPLAGVNNARKHNTTLRVIWRWLSSPEDVSVNLANVKAASAKAKDFEFEKRCHECRYAIFSP